MGAPWSPPPKKNIKRNIIFVSSREWLWIIILIISKICHSERQMTIDLVMWSWDGEGHILQEHYIANAITQRELPFL